MKKFARHKNVTGPSLYSDPNGYRNGFKTHLLKISKFLLPNKYGYKKLFKILGLMDEI
jgi:hypothetical protein